MSSETAESNQTDILLKSYQQDILGVVSDEYRRKDELKPEDKIK